MSTFSADASATIKFTPTCAEMSIFSKSVSPSIVFTPTCSQAPKHSAQALATIVFTAVVSHIRQPFTQCAATITFGLTARARVQLGGDPTKLKSLLATGLSGRYPFNFAETADGQVLMSNGIDPMLKWDGSAASAVPAGVPAPTAPVTIAVAGDTVSTESIFGYVRFVDRDGNPSDLSPISVGALGYTTISSVTYSKIPAPSGLFAGNVSRRQLLRNTLGQTATFYVDLDSYDLTSTTLVSTQTDAQLSAGEPVPIFDDLGDALANAHGFPPSWKSAVVAHLGRMFAAADVPYGDGHVQVTAGSDQVQGVGTAWPANFEGRALYVPGAPVYYFIQSVDAANQVLTLEGPFEGATALFSFYAIRPAPGERRLVYYTPAGEVEGWPATNAIQIQEDGDDITGLMTMGSFLYVLEREHIYRFTFKDDPATDGAVFLASQRGCLNQRMWVHAEDVVYMLDEQGIHAFTGGQAEPISQSIQDLFRDDTDSPLRIDWSADQTLWSASYSEVHATIRWFVAMTGTRYPRHALCYNYREQRWWIEEYHRPVCSTARARIGVVRLLAGVDHREVIALDVGYTDGPRDPTGTLRGKVTAKTSVSITDANANFTADMANCAVFLVAGRGKGQWRRVVAIVGTTRLNVIEPWLISPDATTEYVVGGIDWHWRGGWFRFTDGVETSNVRDVEMVYAPQVAGTMDLQLFYNHDRGPRAWSSSRDGTAVVTAGDPEVVVDMTFPEGMASLRLEGHREGATVGDRYVSPLLSGVQVSEPTKVFRVTLNGAEDVG